ncbi:putative bifunctional diguanylate cyclase/phosphodiesterase [Caballeronia concitans]|uniref:Response regulator receiver modulated diguanylate cyclase/phosphodiesterase n=1 Tax=Caballeronia concitans TaxID=1777133 RepID=A0A658QZS7_9BURK|nr:EAL domain-containing protein [Caballeronia concitans]KIG10699.1 diguanylate cyclase/phosphodiesterase with MHYT sensor [Burkholderia sp. MR1]SAL35762.1 response regulator receiver modulated diguanylate cyclase/phosphodiesterase [Caballeronia concitans]
MHGIYNFWLVAASLVVATLASYTALDISGRLAALSASRMRHVWLAGGAASMGTGIWSMHFIGVLAFSLPIPLGYDLRITAASLAVAIFVSFFALSVINRAQLTFARLAASSVLMGAGIATMHYMGDAAMRMQPAIVYDPLLFVASVAIAVVASGAAMWIARALSDASQSNLTTKRIASAFVMGIAITGMHYTGNAAANFPLGAVCGAANDVDVHWLATTVTLFTFGILIITLVLSRLDTHNAMLAGSVTRLHGQIVHMATFDTLTELPNRSTMTDRIERAVRHATQSGTRFAILFMDLDGFKTINDSLGHSTGDEVLKAFARRLLQCVRGGDTVARLGGDEFVVMLENMNAHSDAERLAERILDATKKGLVVGAHPLQVTPSIGIALFPDDGESVEALLKHADVAMYEAKRGGRSTYRFFEASMNEAAVRTLQIQQALHEALSGGYFFLLFQPKFRGDGELAGAEALIRLDHPQIGLLTPLEFIPIAERSGQIVEIGYWVVRETCRQITRWREAGRPPVKVAINLSPRQMNETDLVARVMDILREEHVASEHLMFEITETVAMQDAPRTIEMIRAFQDNGFEIAIDDFGTGYSSLAYLQRFRAKQLKIDRFFTNGLDENGQEGRAIVSAIIALAHSLDMDVVAEGVETKTQQDRLRDLMCDEMQGFLLAKPLSAQAFEALLETGVVV